MYRKKDIAPTATHVSAEQLADRYGVVYTTIWRWTEKGNFPKPVKLSKGCTRWKLADVEKWESDRK